MTPNRSGEPRKLILASASPRRTDLLREWGIPHDVHPSRCHEHFDAALPRNDAVADLALQKARAVRDVGSFSAETWILGADTLVFLGSEALGKPVDADDARETLTRISGNAVDVVTGVALIHVRDGRSWLAADCSTCRMRPFGVEEVEAYIATGEPLGKAGSFAIQGKGGALIEGFEGSHSNIVGLPRKVVLDLLSKADFPT